jgi:hypothetical protein
MHQPEHFPHDDNNRRQLHWLQLYADLWKLERVCFAWHAVEDNDFVPA